MDRKVWSNVLKLENCNKLQDLSAICYGVWMCVCVCVSMCVFVCDCVWVGVQK